MKMQMRRGRCRWRNWDVVDEGCLGLVVVVVAGPQSQSL